MAAKKSKKPAKTAKTEKAEDAPKKPRARRTPRKAAADSAGLLPAECVDTTAGSAALEPLRARIVAEGGVVIGAYRDPLGGHSLLLAVLPIATVAPTPFQRDLSEAHHKRLAEVIHKTGRFLD